MTFDELDAVFAARGWLSGQPARFRRDIIVASHRINLPAGSPLFHIGDDPGGVYGIASGSVAVLGGDHRLAPVMAHVERAGSWFGHGPILTGGARILSFTTLEPSLLLHLPLLWLRTNMEQMPGLAIGLARMADQNTATVIQTARALLIPRTPQRLAAVLLHVTAQGNLSTAHPDGYVMTQSQLGEMANVSRSQVNRILAGFEQAGWLRLHYHRIALLDVAALQGFAYAEP